MFDVERYEGFMQGDPFRVATLMWRNPAPLYAVAPELITECDFEKFYSLVDRACQNVYFRAAYLGSKSAGELLNPIESMIIISKVKVGSLNPKMLYWLQFTNETELSYLRKVLALIDLEILESVAIDGAWYDRAYTYTLSNGLELTLDVPVAFPEEKLKAWYLAYVMYYSGSNYYAKQQIYSCNNSYWHFWNYLNNRFNPEQETAAPEVQHIHSEYSFSNYPLDCLCDCDVNPGYSYRNLFSKSEGGIYSFAYELDVIECALDALDSGMPDIAVERYCSATIGFKVYRFFVSEILAEDRLHKIAYGYMCYLKKRLEYFRADTMPEVTPLGEFLQLLPGKWERALTYCLRTVTSEEKFEILTQHHEVEKIKPLLPMSWESLSAEELVEVLRLCCTKDTLKKVKCKAVHDPSAENNPNYQMTIIPKNWPVGMVLPEKG